MKATLQIRIREKSVEQILQLELPLPQYEQLAKLARNRHLPVEQIAQLAVVEWLEQQARLVRAREAMRELARGLGEGAGASDGARQHDKHLYSHNRI